MGRGNGDDPTATGTAGVDRSRRSTARTTHPCTPWTTPRLTATPGQYRRNSGRRPTAARYLRKRPTRKPDPGIEGR